MGEKFDKWIDELREDVIQGEFGYEEGEFTVFPDHWQHLYLEGLTPREAWQCAMDAHAKHRHQEDTARKQRWAEIQEADAKIARTGR